MCDFKQEDLDKLPYMVAVTDRDLNIVKTNRIFQVNTQTSIEEAQNRKLDSFFRGADFDGFYKQLTRGAISNFLVESTLVTNLYIRKCCVFCHLAHGKDTPLRDDLLCFKVFTNYKLAHKDKPVWTKLFNYIVFLLFGFSALMYYQVSNHMTEGINQIKQLKEEVRMNSQVE